MNDAQRKKFVFWMFALMGAIAVFMAVFAFLHYNRYRLCAMPQYSALHLCVYEFSMEN